MCACVCVAAKTKNEFHIEYFVCLDDNKTNDLYIKTPTSPPTIPTTYIHPLRL